MSILWHDVSNLSDNLQSNRHRLKYLIVVPLLAVVALASYKIGQSASVAKNVEGEDVLIRHRREDGDSGWTGNQSTRYSGGAVYIRWGRNVCGPESDAIYAGVAGGSSHDQTGGGSNYLCLPMDPIWGAYNEGGVVYIRWGRNECGPGSDALYRGVAGGSWYDNTGGGSNYLCLPLDPIWGAYTEGVEKLSKLYGSEYEQPFSFGLNNNHNRPLPDNNVPCVVCRSQTKSSVIMIPARNRCYIGMHTEYVGFLMSEASHHKGRTEFICMDGQPESDPSGFRNENGALFLNMEGVCGSLPCPPYAPHREITCAVCTM